MKCCRCKRAIAGGAETQKMIAEYHQDDERNTIFGFMMSAGPITTATGQLVRAWHHKCFHVDRKREGRGDTITGRVLGSHSPTGYDIANQVLTYEDTASLNPAQVAELGTGYLIQLRAHAEQIARRVGKSLGDPAVVEAISADRHGGPYTHHHRMPLSTYQLRAHLTYAHGVDPDTVSGRLQQAHEELHARLALQAAQAARDDDPGHHEPPEHDWRHQVAVDIEELTAGDS